MDLMIEGLEGDPFHANFIRAPVVTSAAMGVNILARTDLGIVAVEQGKYMVLAFHPELGNDSRIHERFLGRLGIISPHT